MSRSKWIALAVLALLQVGDAVSTHLALRVPGVVELNPLVHGLGLYGAKLTVLAAVVLLVWMTEHMRRVWVVCGIYAAIVGSNLLLVLTH